ncbi:GMC oxidoreductase [Tistrella mobilis]|uniref:GMC oxidoreductase n=1 Tax=Tistrella mobilis TaxID=171437 RepID=UPI003558FDD1
MPKWPVGHAEIAPYIAKAAEQLGISSKFFDPHAIFENRGVPVDELVDRKSEILQTKVFQIAQDIRLGPKYHDELGASPNLRIYHHLNLTQVRLTSNGKEVSHLDCATLNGRKVQVRAKIFALCCHAIENARLLLTSNDVMNVGIGNAHDHVGRYFMDHTHIFASRFIPSPEFPAAYDRMYADLFHLNANVGFTDDFIRKEKLLQYYCRFNPVYMDPRTREAMGYVRDGFMAPGNFAYLRDVATMLGEVGGVARFSLSRTNLRHIQPDYYELEHRLEQAPNPDSRVVISDRRDALGSLIADLDWRILDEDVRSFKLGQERIASEFAALGYGRVELEEITRDLVESRVAGHYHQIGTTRMSDAPEDGVVDRNQRVHGVGNLYIGGSSVFPTAGYSGPTMMIVGFTIRLAEHIEKQLAA